MPTINTNELGPSGSEAGFPYSPDSYELPASITSPTNPASQLLPTNSPTFLVRPSQKFHIPSSPIKPQTEQDLRSYENWVNVQSNVSDEDENEGLIMFPTYNTEASPIPGEIPAARLEDLDVDASTEDSYDESTSGSDVDNDHSSRSSSPCLSDSEFFDDECEFEEVREPWGTTSVVSQSAAPFIFAEDDSAVASQPTRCVDFLAHEWRTGDLWATYNHIHSHRDEIRGSKRLENALWRTWNREHWSLPRVDPEVIHWLKDSDITWLYGPFQPSSKENQHMLHSSPTSTLASTSSPKTHAKSLLKKVDLAKKMSERSQHTLTLLREATAFQFPVSEKPRLPLRCEEKCLSSEAVGLGLVDRKRRVVFNEVVMLYREVIEEPVPDNLPEDWVRDFDDDFGSVD